MGAAATTAKQPLAEVAIKNEIGVLYGEEAQQAFAAAKEDDVVAWPKVQAYAEAHGLLDPKAVLFKNLRQFKIARDQIEAIYDAHFAGTVCEIRWRGEELGDDWRQCALNGAPAKTLDELYAVAEKASLAYGEVMTAACPDGAVLKLAPLKGRARAAAKARNEYARKTAPATSWLFDVVRGSVMCATEDEIVRLYAALDKDPRVDVVRTKNRFNPPCFNGYRDILIRGLRRRRLRALRRARRRALRVPQHDRHRRRGRRRGRLRHRARPQLDLFWKCGHEPRRGLPPGQQKRAKFPTSKDQISAVFHSFRLIFGRAIIYRNGLEAWMLFPERARAEHSR